jgi:voltage-gated potassium channel
VPKDLKVEKMRAVPLFQRCSKQELREIADVADEIALPAGSELMREGARGQEFVIVLSGSVEIRRQGQVIAPREGELFFGEMALISDEPRNATVTATTDLRALVLTARAFRSLLDRSPAIRDKILETMAERSASNDASIPA